MAKKPTWLELGALIKDTIEKILAAGKDGKITIYEAIEIFMFVIKEFVRIYDPAGPTP